MANVELRDLINAKHEILGEIREAAKTILAEVRGNKEQPVEESTKPDRRVVCAAIKNRAGRVIVGIRHYCALMITTLKYSKDDWEDHESIIQGFVDQRGEFLTRTEAWTIAEAAGQILRRVGGDERNGGTLYSENLY